LHINRPYGADLKFQFFCCAAQCYACHTKKTPPQTTSEFINVRRDDIDPTTAKRDAAPKGGTAKPQASAKMRRCFLGRAIIDPAQIAFEFQPFGFSAFHDLMSSS
jgi:hypothetical protein